MATRAEVDQKYLDQANALEAEFFNIVDQGLPSQHWELKAGKSIDEFNQRHGEIWKAQEQELIDGGFMEPITPPEPGRDLAAEIDDLKAWAKTKGFEEKA